MEELDQREQSAGIGFVQQDPENQIVTDKVWHELAFGLESLGYDTPTIGAGWLRWLLFRHSDLVLQERHGAVRRAEAAPEFGVYHGDAASVLILDEPTSQLDPIAAADFLATLGKINRELGTTVVLTEHRLEDAFPLASRVGGHGPRAAALHEGGPAEVGADPARGGTLNVPGHADPDADLGIRAGCGRTLPGHGAGGPGLADEVRGWTPPDGAAV